MTLVNKKGNSLIIMSIRILLSLLFKVKISLNKKNFLMNKFIHLKLVFMIKNNFLQLNPFHLLLFKMRHLRIYYLYVRNNICSHLTIDNIAILSPNHRPKPPLSTLTLTENHFGSKPQTGQPNKGGTPLSPRIAHKTRANQRVQTITKRESKPKPKSASCNSCNNKSPPNLRTNWPTAVRTSAASAVLRMLARVKTSLLYLY